MQTDLTIKTNTMNKSEVNNSMSESFPTRALSISR